MKRVSILVSATALATSAFVGAQACSSDDPAPEIRYVVAAGGTAPVGAAGSAATPAAGAGGASSSTPPAPSAPAGTEGVPPLAPPAAGGSANAGSSAAGAAGAAGAAVDGAMAGAAGAPIGTGGTSSVPVPPPETLCPAAPAPSNGGACVITCTDPCGVFNVGTRLCTCTNSIFACAACGFEGVDDPLIVPPAGALPPCELIDELQEDDESGCVENELCQSIGREDPAANFANRYCGCRDGGWDCDTKPANFP